MHQRRISDPGLLLTMLALVVQLAFGAVVPRPEVALALDEARTICHAPASPDGAPTPSRHPMPDCQFCPLCVSLATPGMVLPGAAPQPPLPQVVAFHRPAVPPATAPPVAAVLSAQPRGPPVPA